MGAKLGIIYILRALLFGEGLGSPGLLLALVSVILTVAQVGPIMNPSRTLGKGYYSQDAGLVSSSFFSNSC